MIVELWCNLCLFIFDNLVLIDLPNLPDVVMSYIESIFDYLCTGAAILANYVPFDYLMVLFLIVVVVDMGVMLYKFVLWILKKIPLLGIE